MNTERPIELGSRRELFVDEYLIAQKENVELRLEHPRAGDVAIVFDAPWEQNIASGRSVFRDDNGVVRLYYNAGFLDDDELQGIQAIAESTDGGKTFTRPRLGLRSFQGDKSNNIVHIGGSKMEAPAFLDTNPDCPPDQKYKGLASEEWGYLYALCSADGLEWKMMSDGDLNMHGTFDTVNVAFWDHLRGCYRSYTRDYSGVKTGKVKHVPMDSIPSAVRVIQSSQSKDFINWSPVQMNRYDDDFDDMHLYTNSAQLCPGAEHITLSFPNRFVRARRYSANHPYEGVNDALFMASRDGVNWKRYAEAWVRPGFDELNWTERNIYPLWQIVETSDKEWSIYISEHYRHEKFHSQLRRYTIRPHRFVSMHADYTGGVFTTKPLCFTGEELHLNLSTSAAGSVRVEVQDETGCPIEGYAFDDMQPIFCDSLDRTVCWNTGSDLRELQGRAIRIKFELKDADVFAFQFK